MLRICYPEIIHGSEEWEVTRKSNHANSSSVYDDFIGNGTKHRKTSKLIKKRRNCLRGQAGLNYEEPSDWVIENLFEPGRRGEKALLDLLGDSVSSSAYYRCSFNEFVVGVSPDGQFEYNGSSYPIEIKTNCRNGKPWSFPPMKTYIQNMFQCLSLDVDKGTILRLEENDDGYLNFTGWIIHYDIYQFAQYFAAVIEEIQKDITYSVNPQALRSFILGVFRVPNQVYLEGQNCQFVESIKFLFD